MTEMAFRARTDDAKSMPRRETVWNITYAVGSPTSFPFHYIISNGGHRQEILFEMRDVSNSNGRVDI